MENQHRKITGYRELSQAEIDLMNKIKLKGVELGKLLDEIKEVHSHSLTHEQDAQRYMCTEYATKDLKQGIMWAVRSVALPDTF